MSRDQTRVVLPIDCVHHTVNRWTVEAERKETHKPNAVIIVDDIFQLSFCLESGPRVLRCVVARCEEGSLTLLGRCALKSMLVAFAGCKYEYPSQEQTRNCLFREAA